MEDQLGKNMADEMEATLHRFYRHQVPKADTIYPKP